VKTKASSRPKLPRVSEEMKEWSSAIGREVAGWPIVSTRPFFGFTAFYLTDNIFALLPGTRGMDTANSMVFKLESPTPALRGRLDQDSRVTSTHMGKAHWFTFELSSVADLHGALDWLGRAYEAAWKKRKSE
jgi:predicted DNA-binding protein (MmcQ/YjbR family)